MSKSCCENKESELENLREKQGSILKAVLVINLFMFIVEVVFGFLSKSSSLTADSLDMLGDATVYAFSLYALNRGRVWRAKAGYLKGLIMGAFALFILGQTLYRLIAHTTPESQTMGIVGAIALVANLICLGLLYAHRADGINMRSTWICSRNDIVANLSVLAASALVAYYHSGVPDIVVGFGLAALFLKSAISVTREAKLELKAL